MPRSTSEQYLSIPASAASAGPADALLFTRLERNRLVLHDPASARLFVRAVPAAALRRWDHGLPHYLLVATPEAVASFPAIRRALDERRLAAGWLPPQLPDPVPLRIAWQTTAPHDAALLESGVAVVGEAQSVADDGLALALLGSRIVRDFFPVDPLSHLRLPEIPVDLHAALATRGLTAAQVARERSAHAAEFALALTRAFAPLGVTPGAELLNWWEPDFAGLRAAIAVQFGGDIPQRYQEEWQQRHTDAIRARAGFAATLARTVADIDDLADHCYPARAAHG